jgi:DNA polymerase-3 subunit delta'
MPRFADIRGQDRAHGLLRLAVSRGRLPHAYLFHGVKGVGKTTTAFALAQYLNCEARTEDDSCGRCPSCRKIAHLQHPDVHWIFPMAGSLKSDKRAEHIRKTTDALLEPGIHALSYPGAASIGIGRDIDSLAGSVGELRKQAGYGSMEARVKVFVVSEAERMTTEAANSLLKILEEPPPDNLLVLTTQRPRELLDTIVSRCQLLRFRDLNEDEIVGLLAERVRLGATRKTEGEPPDPRAARLAAALARGSVTHAADLIGEDVVELRNQALGFLNLHPGDPRLHAAIKDLVQQKDRAVVARIIDFGLLWLGDLLRAAAASDVPLANRDLEKQARAAAASLPVEEIRRRSQVLEQARAAMNGNVYLPLVLHGLANGLGGEEVPEVAGWRSTIGRTR